MIYKGAFIDLYKSRDKELKDIEADKLVYEILMPKSQFINYYNLCINNNKYIQETIKSLSTFFMYQKRWLGKE